MTSTLSQMKPRFHQNGIAIGQPSQNYVRSRGEIYTRKKTKQQPTAELRKEVTAWIRAMRKHEAKRTANDPGPIPTLAVKQCGVRLHDS